MANFKIINTSEKTAKTNEESKLEVKIDENVKDIGKIIELVKSQSQATNSKGLIFGIDANLMVNTEAVVFLISGIYILVLKSELKRIA